MSVNHEGDRGASLRMFESLRPQMPVWPDGLFWKFAVKAVAKAVYFGAICGALWGLLTFWSTSDDGNLAKTLFLLGFLVDGLFIFTISLIAFLSGLSHNNWSNIIQGAVEGRKDINRRFLWCVILNMSIGILSRYMTEVTGGEYSYFTYISINFFISTLMGMAAAYRVFMLYFVFGKRDYAKYVKSETEGTSIWRRWSFPFRDESKMKFAFIPALLIPGVALEFARWASQTTELPFMISISYGAAAGFLIGVLGVLIRLFDMIKIYGEQERLFPYYELDLMRGPWRPLSPEEDEEIYGPMDEEDDEGDETVRPEKRATK